MQEIVYELIVLDKRGNYFDSVGEYSNLNDCRNMRDMYITENPGEKYRIDKITREKVE